MEVLSSQTGGISEFITGYDWGKTQLGEFRSWSSDLKAAVEILATELERSEARLTRDSGDSRYQALFDFIDQGFCVCELIFDGEGKAIDYKFLEVNHVFEAITGLSQVENRLVSEVIPNLERFWFNTYAEVVLTGKSVRVENQAATMNMWFDVNAFPIEIKQGNGFGLLFTDISDRKRKELKTNFLTEIQKDLLALADANQIMSVVGEKIKAFFGFSLLIFADIDIEADLSKTFFNVRDADIPDTVATHRFSDYWSPTHLEILKTGQAAVIADVTTDPEIRDGGAAYAHYQVRSLISAPHLRAGELKFVLGGCRRQSSQWRTDEVKLMIDLTEKIYLRIERARAEAALQQSNQRFEMAMQAINGVLYEWNLATDQVYRSEGLFKLIGIHVEDAIPTKQWWMDRIHPEDREHLEEMFAILSDGGGTHSNRLQSEYRVLHADGRWIDVWDRSVILRNSVGEIVSIIGSTSDISDLKYAERRLRESEKLYRAIGETIDYGIWINDARGMNVYVSSSFLNMTGITQEQCSGLNWSQYLHPEECDRTIQAWLECVRTESNWDTQHRYLGADGNYRNILSRGIPVRNEYGEVIYWAGINLDITRLKQTEELLRHSEERLRLTIDSTNVGTWDQDITNNRLFWSDRMFELFGYEPHPTGAATVETWNNCLHPDDAEAVRSQWQHSLEQGIKFQREFRIVRADNQEIRWVEVIGSFVCNPEGQAIRSTGVIFDISDRKYLEEALYFSRERMNLVIDSADIGIWYYDIPFNKLEVNDTCKVQLGLSFDLPITIDLVYKHIHFSDCDRVKAQITAAIENHQKYDAEFRTVADNGDVRSIRAIGQVFYHAGKPMRFDVVTMDMTKQKGAEQDLHESEARYRHLAESIPQLVWVANMRGENEYVSQQMIDYTGLAFDRLLGFDWEAIIHPDDLALTIERWTDTCQNLVVYENEYRLRCADGSYRWHLGRAIPVKDAEGNTVRLFGTATDIEEQKKLGRELEKTVEQLQERNQELDQFAHIVSHDLKAPLRAIANLAQWIEEDNTDILPADSKAQMQLLRERVARMNSLLNAILEFAKIGRTEVKVETVSVPALVAEIVGTLPLPPEFTVEIDPNLPTLSTQAILLRQVFANLLDNAIKHHPNTSGWVKVTSQDLGDYYEFAIADNGKGIDPESQQKSFLIFQTLENNNPNNTGVGLAIVKKIINSEGGKIYLESEVGKGSTFYFTWLKSQPS